MKMLIYLHIPKTGGTSMLEVLSGIYGPYSKELDDVISGGAKIWWPSQAKVLAASSNQLGRVPCILGHIAYGLHHSLNFPCQYMTMLRNPVDRVVSQFYHRRGQTGGGFQPWLEMGFDKNTTLYEYVSAGTDIALFNAQTAQLAGILVDDRFNPYAIPDTTNFLSARERLGEMPVGILEHFQKSLELFARELNWPSVPKPVKENARKHPLATEQDPRAISIILEQNKFDLMLWGIAKEKLLTDSW